MKFVTFRNTGISSKDFHVLVKDNLMKEIHELN